MNKPKPFIRTIHADDYLRGAQYAVHGFWSEDSVRVVQYRDDHKTAEGQILWSDPHINWSCGGGDYEAEPDRIFAAECFAAAIKDAAKVAKRWRKETGKP